MMKQDRNEGGVIRVAELDPNFKSEVMKHEDAQGLYACFACGTCTAGCPVHEIFPEYNPRKLAKMVKLGMRQEVLSSPYIWYCVTCHNCEQRCPQNVKFFNILNVLKNMSAKKGYAPTSWVEQTQQITKTGLIFPIDETLAKKREVLSLPAIKSDGKKAKRLIQLTDIDKIKAQRGR
jgi:heterodisulfide reductase subunit C